MIDLSFLTEEEQETILAVLKRDAELKKAEEQRIQNLQKTVSDRSQLKYLSGEWFYETKQRRHQESIHGSDIIRASMKHTSKPLTILEISQMSPQKSSFVGSENKEVSVPAVLCGLLQEPYMHPSGEGRPKQNPFETVQDTQKADLPSPTKQRKNPFNSDFGFDDQDGAVDQTPNNDDLGMLELHDPAMSSFVSAQQQSGKPVHLEIEPEEDGQAEDTHWSAGYSICSAETTSDAQTSVDGSLKRSSHVGSPKPTPRLLGMIGRQKHTTMEEDESPPCQEHREETRQMHIISKEEEEIILAKPGSVQHKIKASERTIIRTLHLTALQNMSFEETVTSVNLDASQDVPQHPEKLFNPKEFCATEDSTPKKTAHGEFPKTGIESLHCPHTHADVSGVRMIEEDIAGSSQLKSSQTDSTLFPDVSEDDCTYRANPVLIYDEPDDPSTEIQISQSQIPESNHPSQEHDFGVLESSSVGQEERLIICQKDSTEPAVISLSSSVFVERAVLFNNREKVEEATPTCPHKSKSEVFRPCRVTDKGFVNQNSEKSQQRSFSNTVDLQSACEWAKPDTEAQERSFSPIKSKDHDEEIRRSPSKTCHPKILPRESSGTERPRLEGSPLKTFPIDISPTRANEEQKGRPTPIPRQKKNPSPAAKHKGLEDANTNISPTQPPLHQQTGRTYIRHAHVHQCSSNTLTPPLSRKAAEKKLATSTRLTRSVIPQDHQHYLGPQEKAHIPPFQQDEGFAAESDAVHTLHTVLGGSVENQRESSTNMKPSNISSWIVPNKDRNFSEETTAKAWSLSRASLSSYGESSSPVVAALERLSSRSMSSSKSVEKLSSQTREEPIQNNSREQMNLSVEDAATLCRSKLMKTSVSVPVLQMDETDSDGTADMNLECRRNTSSSMSNLSLSSGLASMSSVSGSMSSIYPADFGDIEVQGNIQFAVNYIQKLEEFHIFVVHCRDLAVADIRKHRSDPYVKCYLLPDDTKLGKRKTTVKKKTLNPTYNEILRFKVKLEVLKNQNLNISVWHNETFGRNSFLGEVDLDLSEWDFSNTQINEYALKPRVSVYSSEQLPSRMMDDLGEMRVALRFVPQTSISERTSRMETGEVQIWVKVCKNLPPVRGFIIDPFVKCTVLPDTSRKSRQKTRVVKRTANPMFNHTMVYDGFRPEDLSEACVELTVWDHDRLSNRYIGGLRLGLGTGKSYGVEVVWMDSTAGEANLWQRMLQSDGEWVEDVLPLRMLVMAKGMSK
ncbi:synaptotagmin-like protein 2 [Pholidichthys leucotaenia]